MKLRKWLGVFLTMLLALCVGLAVAACGPVGDDNKITVTYYDGTQQIHQEELDKGSVATYTAPSKLSQGFDFEGWYFESELTNKYEGTELEKDTDLYANYVTHEHSPGFWTSTFESHSRYCNTCRTQLDNGPHTMEDGYCTVCGVSQEDLDNMPKPAPSVWAVLGEGKGTLKGEGWTYGSAKVWFAPDDTYEGDGELYTVELTLYAGDRFKVHDGSAWLGMDVLGEGANYFVGSDDGYGGQNIALATGCDGVYLAEFYVNGSSYRLDFTQLSTIDPMESSDFYLIGSYGGDWNDACTDTNKLIKGDDGNYRITITVTASDIFPSSWDEKTQYPNHAAFKVYDPSSAGYYGVSDNTSGTSGGSNIFVTVGTWTFGFSTATNYVYFAEGNEVDMPGGHTHSYTQWAHNDEQHWKVCPTDGAIDEASKAGHSFDNGACECGATEGGDQPDVPTVLDQRTYFLVGNGQGTIKASNWTLSPAPAAVTFTRETGTNTYTLKNFELMVGDEMKLGFAATWGTDSAYAFGAYFFSNASDVFEKSEAWADNAVVANGKSGKYNITLVTAGANTSSTAVAEGQIVSFTFECVESYEVTTEDMGWYLTGAMNNWSATAPTAYKLEETAPGSGIWEGTFTFASSYEMKAIHFTKTVKSGVTTYAAKWSGQSNHTTPAGTYKLTYNAKTDSLTHTAV